MKRSDAIKLMVAFQDQAYKRFRYSISDTELMDGVLLQLEKAGMLPPPAKLQKLDTIENRVWETEDEKE